MINTVVLKGIVHLQIGMDRLIFLKRSFRYENDDKKKINKTIVFKNVFLMEIVFKKIVVFKTIVFKKLVVLLTIVNDKPSSMIVIDDPLLTIVNEERRREETNLKGISTYH